MDAIILAIAASIPSLIVAIVALLKTFANAKEVAIHAQQVKENEKQAIIDERENAAQRETLTIKQGTLIYESAANAAALSKRIQELEDAALSTRLNYSVQIDNLNKKADDLAGEVKEQGILLNKAYKEILRLNGQIDRLVREKSIITGMIPETIPEGDMEIQLAAKTIVS